MYILLDAALFLSLAGVCLPLWEFLGRRVGAMLDRQLQRRYPFHRDIGGKWVNSLPKRKKALASALWPLTLLFILWACYRYKGEESC